MTAPGYLAFIGVETTYEFVETEDFNHAFLRLPDGRVLDPTADQYGHLNLPPIYIGPALSIHGADESLVVKGGE